VALRFRVGGLAEGGVEIVFSLGGGRFVLRVGSRVWAKGKTVQVW
jgi:hypothetical protein